jgi:cyclic beta-1,2-glucan synthetase
MLADSVLLSGELLTTDELERFAGRLAASHELTSDPRRSRPLLPALDAAAARLSAAYRLLSESRAGRGQTTSAADWIADNFHVVDDQVREIRHDLPPRYYQQLVKLADGPGGGLPRIYHLAAELVAHTEGQLTFENVTRFANAYQRVVPFSIGEVWAIPIMLRIALVEELARLADLVVDASRQRDAARAWIARFTERADVHPPWFERLLQSRSDRPKTLSPAFVVELLQWLRDAPPVVLPVWRWLQARLERQSVSADDMIRRDQQLEASAQLVLGNIIGSMRLLSSLDWRRFFEAVSLVQRILCGDPAGAYAAMDFETADRYRRSIEQLARGSNRAEEDVARRVVAKAADVDPQDDDADRRRHVGYYLIARGRFELERELAYRPAVRERLARFVFRHPAIGYLGVIAVLLGLSLASLVTYGHRHGGTTSDLVLIALVVLIPVSELVISMVNRVITSQVPPRPLPKLALANGIPPSARTLVVVPVILSGGGRIRELFEQLEVRFLANRDRHLHFALLGDFPDAPSATTPEDDALVSEAVRRTEELNDRYGADLFFLLHRDRRWSESEQRWMGWERKRGKLHELNRLLRGARDTSYAVRVGTLAVLEGVRYVITLDSDTRLPLDAARRLVGTLAHPLNRAGFDAQLQRVTEGYGVLQPRIEVESVSATRTAFARVYAGQVGLDPYSSASCDIYQDLFHEGNYVGKGIYDVDAFEAALANRVPENRLLSHDLFEGFYARAGLCTDITLVDEHPGSYLAWAARLHRWVRGDWQIARWLWPTVPGGGGATVRNTLPLIARWKILDNLRRSLLGPSLLMLLAAAWVALPGSPFVWTMIAVLVLGFPAYVELGHSLSQRAHGIPLREHLRYERRTLVSSARLAVFQTAFLAHQAWLMTDAIARTLYRLIVTRRHLLEWESAADVAERLRQVDSTLRRLWVSPALAALLLVLVVSVAPSRLAWAAAPLGLWLAAPALAYSTGRPRPARPSEPTSAERRTLRYAARRTWRYFEDFVTEGDHWLAPDNIQEGRPEPIAHRTSPTNVGLQMLSVIAASDFGYVSVSKAIERLERTFDTLVRLGRHRGHFFNWYDTRSLAPLVPLYVSTVDSGNLAGYLLTLKEALAELIASRPIVGSHSAEGIDDTAAILEQEIDPLLRHRRRDRSAVLRLRQEIVAFRRRLRALPSSLPGWHDLLAVLAGRVSAIEVVLHEAEDELQDLEEVVPAFQELHVLTERLAGAVRQWHEEIQALAPWVDRGSLRTDVAPDGFPSEPALATLSVAAIEAWTTRLLRDLDPASPLDHDLRQTLTRANSAAARLALRAAELAELADELVSEMDFEFLFDPNRRLFSIGFSVTDGRLDASFYDLLASEARLASFVAIATGKVPRDHWFALGRALTPAGGTRALLSWSGSMFEYFMPLLVMRSYPETLLDETYDAVLERQIAYGAERGAPWGVSEAAYNLQDLERNYQYKAFGVPGLGLKRGLGEELVVAPYATFLAAPLRPAETVRNLRRLAEEGLASATGFHESIDYTPDRLAPAPDHRGVVIRTSMAHHLGMTMVALDNAVRARIMQRRFHAEPRVQAAELLLQERIPQLVPLKHPPAERVADLPGGRTTPAPTGRRYVTPHTLSPRAHLLSNGSYTVMITNAGGGYSRRRDLAVTRWREDLTRDASGAFTYVRDRTTGRFWSTAHQPTLVEPDDYEVSFTPDRAVFRRRDGDIELLTDVAVSAEDDAEFRRVSITNRGSSTRHLDVTSYAEVVLAPPAADIAHPAFGNLFVETTALPDRDALLCTRRPRGTEPRVYLAHVVAGRGRVGEAVEYETARARFLGRLGDVRSPEAMRSRRPLSRTVGAVLDPIVSLRQTLELPPGGTARLAFTTAFATAEESARALVDKYRDRRSVGRALALSTTHGAIELRHLNLSPEGVRDIQRLFSRMIYGDPRLRPADAAARNRLAIPELWRYGISGDLPILLVRISEGSEVSLVREMLKAHEYGRTKGFQFDLVIVNEHGASYLQDLQGELQRLVSLGLSREWIDRPGGVFLRRADLMPSEHQLLLAGVARTVLIGAHGSLHNQLTLPSQPTPMPASLMPARPPHPFPAATPDLGELAFFNGYGGFSPDGREYVVRVTPDAPTPAPWSNVVANARFGFVATEAGPGYTWSENSHENRLSPWSNDPVADPAGEALYVRDDETGEFWSATPLPAPDAAAYVVRHGQGYSAWEHEHGGLRSTLLVYVAPDDPVKLWRLRLENRAGAPRRISAFLYVDWVLGEVRERSRPHVVSRRDPATGAVFASNRCREHLAERVAFLHGGRDTRSMTADRTEFIGRNGSLVRPASLARRVLGGRVGPLLDPCGAVQVTIDIGGGEAADLVFLLGEGATEGDARSLIGHYGSVERADQTLDTVRRRWDDLARVAQVRTPDGALDLLLNRWLPYQTLSARLQGRTGFYQSSGAFGFRDQLQDVLALLVADPGLARRHLLRAAARQFVEGDVQHWWHEPGGQGVRTRCSDDRLWLPYATLEYCDATGDDAVLAEMVPFLEGQNLEPDRDEVFETPTGSRETATLYEHCARAVDRSLAVGAHGLPLIGTGDWNDGLNLVGWAGAGESVWLGWFLVPILRRMAVLADARGESARAAAYRRHAGALVPALDEAWDGDWFRRAYFDDGTPLGSQASDECRIDAIAQSWAVLSGAAHGSRSRHAMESVERHLVRPEDRLVMLLTPPFDRMIPDPGYIRGYLPGVRENGGQYTHAALWNVLAWARLGDGDRAFELLSMINPIHHASSAEGARRYAVEPYVVPGDVYSRPPHTGRGGWTWYTGSAGWMYRVALDGILGVWVSRGRLRIDPCIPRAWIGYEAAVRIGQAEYAITVENPQHVCRGVARIEVDGVALKPRATVVPHAEGRHTVRVVLGAVDEDRSDDRDGADATARAGGPRTSGDLSAVHELDDDRDQ